MKESGSLTIHAVFYHLDEFEVKYHLGPVLYSEMMTVIFLCALLISPTVVIIGAFQ